MRQFYKWKMIASLMLALTIVFSLAGCGGGQKIVQISEQDSDSEPDPPRYLTVVEDEPKTVDFQCTSIYYTIAQNAFDCLVEMDNDENGGMVVLPALAQSWEISEDGRKYSFHLRENVTFSNGSPLTASDVEYTFVRLLTHPNSCNKDIADGIVGAQALEKGEASELKGFEVLGDLDFAITLEKPFEAFLACLSMPGASILDRETTEEAGDRFGIDPDWTIGTGSFVLSKWVPGEGMILTANKDCWRGAPKCDGYDLRFITDVREIRRMFEDGEIDILDLDEAGNAAEFFKHGDIYQDRLFSVPRIGITYIALNQNIEPLNEPDVRKAMQYALNRAVLLQAVYGGEGAVENGIFPKGLYGHNPDLAEIPYDPEEAMNLLAEAGYPDGFDLTVSVNSSSTRWELSVLRLAASMWEKIGIRTTISVLDAEEFLRLRKSGKLTCYTAEWMADFNDPDNFIYTFFGNHGNTEFRSLCYPREDIMERVRLARTIADPDARLQEYRELEKIIVQDDAAWIPLYSRQRFYVTSKRVGGIRAAWNGSVKNEYREMYIVE